MAALLYGRVLTKALGTRNVYTASTVDQRPKEIASALMFGGSLTIAVPDVDRTDHLLILGANPLASNGSLLTAPDMRGRLRAIQERGGKVVVVDPRRSRTAEVADEHHFIRPGTDAHLLFALVHVILEEGLARPGRLAELCDGFDALEPLARDFTPEAAAAATGIEADAIRGMARELAAAERAAVYGRIGTTTQEFGTLASWLVDVLNVLTGNLDREGGAMFPRAAAGARNTQGEPGRGRGVQIGRWTSRVRGLPESLGELPVACLAEEIETPGDGQIRALITLAGNPARSTPNSGRLEAALESLDFCVAFDLYLNETTRHADVILPPPSPLAALALRPRLLPAVGAQHRELLAGRAPARARPAGRVAHAAAAGRRGRAARGRRVDVDASRPHGRARGRPPRGRRPRGAAWPSSSRGAGPSASSTRCSASAPTATASALDPRPPLEARAPARHRPRPARAAPPGGAAHAERQGRAGAAGDRRRRRRACAARSRAARNGGDGARRPPPAALQQLVDAQPRRCSCSGKERCTLHVHPDDAARLGLTDGEPARVSGREPARSRCRSR